VSAVSGGPGAGSEFVIRLPASGANTPLPAAAPSMATLAPRDRKVLIIDDNEDAAESLSAFLEESGLSCASALDGPSGLDAVARFAPDTILIDLGLPGLDGYEVARRIRGLPGGDKYLAIAITGYGRARDRERSAEAGFDAHLVKPVDLDQLLTILHTMDRMGTSEAPHTGSWKRDAAAAMT